MTRYFFGEFKPDLPAHLSEGLVMAENVIPIANGYGPVGSFSASANGVLSDQCMGAGAYRHQGETYVFAVTETDIYRYTASGYSSLVTGLTTNDAMRFCPFGKFMLATNGADPIQRFDPGSPTVMTVLAGTPPTARFLGVVRGILVAGYADGNPLRVEWSDTGDPTGWTPGGASLAGLYDMPSGGDITGVVGGEYGLIFQERRIVRMTFTGDSTIWQWDEISSDIGCIVPGSLASFGRVSMFLSAKGFMMFDGVSVTPIGDQKIDKTFLSRAQATNYVAMSAAIDPINSLYVVALPSTNPATDLFVYSYLQNKWTTIRTTTERLFSSFGLNFSLEDLDAIYASIDAMTTSLDSAEFKGGRPILCLFNGSHELGTLSGVNAAATILDQRREIVPGRRARLRSIRTLTNAQAPTVAIYGRNALSDSDTMTSFSEATASGYFRMKKAWNFVQVGLSIPSNDNWTFAQGFDVDAVDGGRQ